MLNGRYRIIFQVPWMDKPKYKICFLSYKVQVPYMVKRKNKIWSFLAPTFPAPALALARHKKFKPKSSGSNSEEIFGAKKL